MPTTVSMCWDSTALHLRFESDDSRAWGTITDEDGDLFDEEVVEAFLSSSGDLRRYVELEWSPLSVPFHATVWSPDVDRRTMTVDRGWRPEGMTWSVGANVPIYARRPTDDAGHDRAVGRWTVTVDIPFVSLPGTGIPRQGDTWRANFYRIRRGATDEYSAWSPTLERPANFHVPARFGAIEFVT